MAKIECQPIGNGRTNEQLSTELDTIEGTCVFGRHDLTIKYSANELPDYGSTTKTIRNEMLNPIYAFFNTCGGQKEILYFGFTNFSQQKTNGDSLNSARGWYMLISNKVYGSGAIDFRLHIRTIKGQDYDFRCDSNNFYVQYTQLNSTAVKQSHGDYTMPS